MYKLVIKDKYYLYGMKNKFLGAYNNIQELAEASIEIIRTNELKAALKFMSDTTHNVAEFGARGYYTVSYYSEVDDE